MVCSKRVGLCVAHKRSFHPLAVFIATIVLLIPGLSFGMSLSFGGGTTSTTTLAAATYLTSIPTNIGEPARIAIDDTGFLYVSVPERGKILKFSPDGSQVGIVQGFQEPLSLAVHSALKRVYIGDSKDGSVGVVSPEGTFLFNLGKGKGEFGMPADIAVAADGSVYVTDSPNNVVKVYNPDGSFRLSFGGTGVNAGQMVFPTGIAADDVNQEIYVVDHTNGRVEVFDFSGSFKRTFSRFGGGSGSLTRPQGIWVSKGRVYVADAFQGIVSVFDTNGAFIANIGQFGSDDGSLRTPKDVALSGRNLFVTNAGNRRIEAFTISDPMGLKVEPSAVAFTHDGVAIPASQVIQLTSDVTGSVVSWTATVSAPFSLLLSQATGSTPSSVTVTATAGNLAPGTYFGGVIFRANDTDYPVSVSMTVVPQLSVFPSSLSLLYQVGGDLTAKSLAVSSSGTLTWTAATNVPWLTLSPASGSTPGSVTVAVNQDVKKLSEGLFPAAVTISSSGGGAGGTSIIPVALKVLRAGTIIVNTNLDSASFAINGSETYAGSGKTWRTDEAAPGTYSIEYGQVKGFRTPPSGTFEIKTGQTVVLDGRYRPMVAANVIAAAKGPDSGNDALVKLLDLTGISIAQFKAFDTTYGARVAMGDLDGDGYGEIVAAPGPGPKNEARIAVFRTDGTPLASTAPMTGTKYGAHVAVGDIDGSGKSMIAISTIDKPGIGIIVLYGLDDSRTLAEKTRIAVGADPGSDRGNTGKSIIGNDDPQPGHYPASIAFGDVNHDGSLELIVVTSGRIEVYGFDNALAASLLAAGTLPFEGAKSDYKAQLTVTSGDLDGEGADEIIVGHEADQDSYIRAFKGDLTASGLSLKAFEKAKSAPTLSAQDWDGDGLAEILAGQGANPDNNGVVRIYGPQGDLLREITAFEASRYGVVAAFGTVKK